jgi:hypothetical protein
MPPQSRKKPSSGGQRRLLPRHARYFCRCRNCTPHTRLGPSTALTNGVDNHRLAQATSKAVIAAIRTPSADPDRCQRVASSK